MSNNDAGQGELHQPMAGRCEERKPKVVVFSRKEPFVVDAQRERKDCPETETIGGLDMRHLLIPNSRDVSEWLL